MKERKANFVVLGIHAVIVAGLVWFLLNMGVDPWWTWAVGIGFWSQNLMLLAVNIYFYRHPDISLNQLPSNCPQPPSNETLGWIAFHFRGTRDEAERAKYAKQYAEVVDQLIASGKWNEIPGPEDTLPDQYMPAAFKKFWFPKHGG